MMTTRHLQSRAFTLVEMLVVLGIIAILATLAMSGTSSLLDNSSLTSAGQTVAGQIAVARQLASTLNETVQVRLVQTTGTVGLQGIQVWAANSSGVSYPLTQLMTIPDSTVIDTNTSLSPLLNPNSIGYYPSTGRAANALYYPFSIRPSGIVEAVPTGTTTAPLTSASLYFTIVKAHLGSVGTAPPNYITIQLNPDTASTLVYQPHP
jgi:uncharacterized protein (TIGR02596 family)